jgi:hypothetical protein
MRPRRASLILTHEVVARPVGAPASATGPAWLVSALTSAASACVPRPSQAHVVTCSRGEGSSLRATVAVRVANVMLLFAPRTTESAAPTHPPAPAGRSGGRRMFQIIGSWVE